MSKIDSIIFDLDGTLWSSAKAISEAWGLVLQKHENIEKKEVTEEELYSCMGLPMYDIAAKLFPSLAENIRNQLMDELCEFENGYLEKRGGVLYDGLEETLAQLQKKYKLYIVSNCQDGYIEAFIKAHHMEKYFEDTECWGRTRLSKGESNKILIARNHLKNPIYVGDTAGVTSLPLMREFHLFMRHTASVRYRIVLMKSRVSGNCRRCWNGCSKGQKRFFYSCFRCLERR